MTVVAVVERRRVFIILGAILVSALALLPIINFFLGSAPAFLGAYGALLLGTEFVTAVVLTRRTLRDNDARLAVLAGTYAFATILTAGNILSLPGISSIPFGTQASPWMWLVWHIGWGVGATLFAWHTRAAQLHAGAIVASAVVAGLGLTVLASTFGNDLPALVLPNGTFTTTLRIVGGFALALNAMSAAGLLRRLRSLSVLELWVLVAVVAGVCEVALSLISNERFTVGFYGGRLLSLVSGMAVAASFMIELIHFTQRMVIQEQANEFRALSDLVPQIMWTASADGAIEWYSSAWYDFTGQSRDEAAGWGWQGTHHPDDHADVMRIWPAAIASGDPYEMEFRLRNTRGQYRWFLARGRPYRDDTGRIVRWYGSNTDIDDQKREAERSKRVALTLQSAFLPESLPERDDLTFDAAYVPAESDAFVGGDWYDAITLNDDRILISIGDVAGHGLHAAVNAGRLRQVIISEALNSLDPAEILQRAERLLRKQSDIIATAIVAFYNPEDGMLTYAVAGHPPPIIAVPGERACIQPGGGAPLGMGLFDNSPTVDVHVRRLPEQGLLVFYTDGLIELERDVLAGEAALLAATERVIDGTCGPSASDLLENVMNGRDATDDIALVLLRRCNPNLVTLRQMPLKKTWTFHSSSARSAHDSRMVLMRFLREHAAPEADVFTAELILGELLANTVEHAPGLVEVLIDWTQERPFVRVRDAGPGFDAIQAALPSDELSEDGRGLFLIATLADNLQVSRAPGYGTEISVYLRVERRNVHKVTTPVLPAESVLS